MTDIRSAKTLDKKNTAMRHNKPVEEEVGIHTAPPKKIQVKCD